MANPKHIGFRITLKKSVWHYWSPAIRKLFDDLGEELSSEIKLAIRRQIYDWPALSPRYAQWKNEQGLDPRMLIATGHYISSIFARPVPFGVEVTVPKNEQHPEAAMSYMALAKIHEYGTFDRDGFIVIPMRPHWRPTILNFRNNKLRSFKRKINKQVVIRVRREIHQHIVLKHRAKLKAAHAH